MGQSLLRAAHILPTSCFFIDHNLGVESHVRQFQPRFVRTQRLSMRPLGPHVLRLRTHKNVAYVLFHAHVQMYKT